ncbi:hypothetical protein KY311_00090 [Candidatus Woesearchaeota archaeon]|nr:hypothetical protein [Candidatus Woesearchaeota archaeon]
MKIEIDTSRDSKEELRKLIRMLQAIVGESSNSTWGTAEDSGPTEMVGLGFMDPDNASSAPAAKEDKEDDEDLDIPKIEMY